MTFLDRKDAGRVLAKRLKRPEPREGACVLALPRGGVPVAYEIAQALHLPLDVMLVRKLGVPGHEELAMGAIASGGVRVMNDEIVHSLGISQTAIDEVVAREEHELPLGERQPRDRPVVLRKAHGAQARHRIGSTLTCGTKKHVLKNGKALEERGMLFDVGHERKRIRCARSALNGHTALRRNEQTCGDAQ